MEYRPASIEHTEQIFQLVQNTIQTIYPKYYPKEVVDFFCNLHNKENIKKDIEAGHVGILLQDNLLVGTGSFQDAHITRVYVAPAMQGQGCGSYIMTCLEEKIALQYDKACLDASLPACSIYEHRGYRTIRHEKYQLENGVVLVYEIMEKELR